MNKTWQIKQQRRPSAGLGLGLLAGLLIISFGLRIYRLADKSVWWDEGLAAWAARQSLGAIANWTAHDVHPPLYFWLLHAWRVLSGDSEFGLRLLSALVGLLTVAATFLLGRTVRGRTTGLLAALFITVSRFGVSWSQEMRMYALAALLAALALWAAIRVWDRGLWSYWLLYILFITAGLYTLYLSVSVLVVANLIWLLWVWPRAANRQREFIYWATAQTIVLALFAPWLAYALPRIPTWSSASPVSPLDFVKIYWTVFTVGIPLNVDQYARWTLPVLAIFLVGTAVLLWQGRGKRQNRDALLFITGLLFPAAVVYAVSIPKETFFYAPPVAPRYLIIFLSAYTVLLAWGIVQLSVARLRLLGVGLTAVVLVAAWAGLRNYHSDRILVDDYKSLAMTIEAYKRPSDAVILYTDTDWPIFAYHHPDDWRGVPHAWQITPEVANDFLAPIWEESDGVWLVTTPYAGVSDPQGEMTNWLAERATAVVTNAYEDKALTFYARTPDRAAAVHDLMPGTQPKYGETAVIGGWQMTGYDQAVGDARSGDTLHLFLYGQGDEVTTTVGLVDEQGQVWGETAVNLPATNSLARQQIDLLISPDVPSGNYRFLARVGEGVVAPFGRITVRQKQAAILTPSDVAIANRLDASFEAGIRLLGYQIETDSPQPGGTVYLTLYWQAQESVAQKYKIFTHLLGEVYNADKGNFLWGQQDNEPVNNTRPTTTWRAGEVIVDSYAIPIEAQAPAGPYKIEIGLYDPVTGSRLPLQTGGDHLILDWVAIGN